MDLIQRINEERILTITDTQSGSPLPSGTTPNFVYAIDAATGKRIPDINDANNVYAMGFSADRACLYFGRYIGTEGAISTVSWDESLLPQYSMFGGWRMHARGTNDGADVKGSFAVGYQGFLGGPYSFLSGYNCATLSVSCFCGGKNSLSGGSSYSADGPIAIVSTSDGATKTTVIVAGDYETEFPADRYVVAFLSKSGEQEALSMAIVESSTYDGSTNTTIVLDRLLVGGYDADATGDPPAWIIPHEANDDNYAFAFTFGDNIRGLAAWSASLGADHRIASTAYASFTSGKKHTVSGAYNITSGEGHITSGDYGSISGYYNETVEDYGSISGLYGIQKNYGAVVQSSGKIVVDGDCQSERVLLRARTTDGSTAVMYLDGSSKLPELSTFSGAHCDIKIYARKKATGGGDASTHGVWEARNVVLCKTGGGTYSLLEAAVVTDLIVAGSTHTIPAIAAAAGGLTITVTGTVATDIRWMAEIRMLEQYG